MACGHSTNGNNNINMMATGITTTDRSCLIEIHEGSQCEINIFTSARSGEVFKDVVYTQDEFFNTNNGFGEFVSLSRNDRAIETNSQAALHMFALRHGAPYNFRTTGDIVRLYDIAWISYNYDAGAEFADVNQPIFITASHNKNPNNKNEVIVSYLRSNPDYSSYRHLYMHRIPILDTDRPITSYYIPDNGPAFRKILDVRSEWVGTKTITATLLMDLTNKSAIHYTNWTGWPYSQDLLQSDNPYLHSIDISPQRGDNRIFEIAAAGYHQTNIIINNGIISYPTDTSLGQPYVTTGALNYSVQREIDAQIPTNINGNRTCLDNETTPYSIVEGDLVTYHDNAVITYATNWTLILDNQTRCVSYKSYRSILHRIQSESVCTIEEQ